MSLYTEQEKRTRWTSAGGWQIVRTWRGPTEERDAFVAGELPEGYSDLELTDDQGVWSTVTATYAASTMGGGAPAETGLVARTWSLESSTQGVPLVGHPKAARLDSLVASQPADRRGWVRLTQLSVALFRYATEEWKKGEHSGDAPQLIHPYGDGPGGVIPDSLFGAVAGATEQDYTFAKYLAEELVKADDGGAFIEFAYVLRKTEVVLTSTALKASHANVGRFFSYSGLTTAEPTLAGSPLLDAGTLPSLYWLKQPPQVQQVSRGQFQIQQDYMGAAEFNSAIYGAAI